MNKQELIDFEEKIANKFNEGEIPYLIHFSGGNENQLLEIFQDVNEGDYIFSTHRSHYHYLLAGGCPDRLEDLISTGKSMFVFDRKLNFYASSIVCATPSIAAGVAWALKRKGSDKKVWCFIGDGAEDEGHFYEAVKYVDGWDLPCTFVIEDNDRSVSSRKIERWGSRNLIEYPSCVIRYTYLPTYPHGGSNHEGWIKFKKEAVIEKIEKKTRKNYIYPTLASSELGYLEAVKESMEMLASKNNAIFIGYNVRHGSAYGTLKNIPENQRLETPLAENLMAGLAIGMSLEGFNPVLFFERHDFIYNALDALVNQVDKIEQLSQGEFSSPIIIRAVAGGIKPFYAGLTHTSNLTELFKHLFSFPVYAPQTSAQVISAYKIAMNSKLPILISERKELY